MAGKAEGVLGWNGKAQKPSAERRESQTVLTPMPERWRSQTGRATNASTYDCTALESNAFSGRDDKDEDDC